jgi:hypothetical protein
VLLPVVAVTPIPPVAPTYCTHHLAESKGYLPLRIRPGAPLDNTNKVADLPNGTCGIVPTGQTVIVGHNSWAEVTVGGMIGWVNAYFLN